ncbi:hypothetical protein ACFVT5_40490 [Streptomyces sp. NPDC058001]|uniref:hypothetical protein n=1 Tax=Streptomyces sp. NPDC058001 TaxID=3346300 RepID=UPI0036EFA8C2
MPAEDTNTRAWQIYGQRQLARAYTPPIPDRLGWASPTSNPIPTCPPSRTTIGTHQPPTGADSASWTSFTQNPTASGTPAPSPATSATSPSARCTDSSTDGP